VVNEVTGFAAVGMVGKKGKVWIWEHATLAEVEESGEGDVTLSEK
jgi:hypothetical protein